MLLVGRPRKAHANEQMRSPWLDIPLADYERHMSLPEVGQAQMLAAEFASAVREFSPRSVAIIGCAGGNGLNRLERSVERIVGIDINPLYIEATRRRYEPRLHCLELYVADIERGVPTCVPVDLVFAALIFEYVDVSATMKVLRTLCTESGTLIVILQCAHSESSAVSPSPYQSLQSLKPVMRLRDETALKGCAESAGFSGVSSRTLTLASGKSFAIMVFRARQ